jgi:hypothetical protein
MTREAAPELVTGRGSREVGIVDSTQKTAPKTIVVQANQKLAWTASSRIVQVFTALVLLVFPATAARPDDSPAPPRNANAGLDRAKTEAFLRSAEPINVDLILGPSSRGPQRIDLADDETTARGIFTTQNVRSQENRFRNRMVLESRDSYKHEIAAYELDKLLGFGIAPPCVERTIEGETGSLCFWLENTMSEWSRSTETNLDPPNVDDWNSQVYTIRLFLSLIGDPDSHNTSLILIDANWKLYRVDFSVAFTYNRKLNLNTVPNWFCRTALESLQNLSSEEVEATLDAWLEEKQIKALIARRDALLELAEKRMAKEGASAVLIP